MRLAVKPPLPPERRSRSGAALGRARLAGPLGSFVSPAGRGYFDAPPAPAVSAGAAAAPLGLTCALGEPTHLCVARRQAVSLFKDTPEDCLRFLSARGAQAGAPRRLPFG